MATSRKTATTASAVRRRRLTSVRLVRPELLLQAGQQLAVQLGGALGEVARCLALGQRLHRERRREEGLDARGEILLVQRFAGAQLHADEALVVRAGHPARGGREID